MMTLTKAQGDAMAQAVKETNNDPAYLKQRVRELEEANAELRRLLREAREKLAESPSKPQKVLQFNGRDVGTQSDLARRWQVKPYTVSRKRDQLEKITDADGKTWYYMDQPQPTRRKKSNSKGN